MSGTIDIGGGFKQYVGDTPEQELVPYQKLLGLQDLANRINQAPVEMKIKQLDAALKSNQLLMADVSNEQQRVALQSAKNQEARQQTQFVQNMLSSLPTLANQSPELAAQVYAKIGVHIAQDKNTGGITASFQQADGTMKSFPVDTHAVADPEKIKGIEKTYREEWQQQSKNYAIQHQQFGAMKKAIALGTGAGDISAMFAYMKLLDPNSSVREGEVASVKQAPGVPTQIINLYNRAVTEKAPIFGPADSNTRANLIDAGFASIQDAKANTENSGRFFINLAKNSKNIDPRNILSPVGDISFESLTAEPTPGDQRVAGPVAPGGEPKKVNEASALGSAIAKPADEARSQSTAPTKSLKDILNSQLLVMPAVK